MVAKQCERKLNHYIRASQLRWLPSGMKGAAEVLNKQSQTNNKGWLTSLQIECMTTVHCKMLNFTSHSSDTCNSYVAEDKMLPRDFAQKYRIMCRNGTKVPLTGIPDDECALVVVTGGEVCCMLT